MTLPKKHQKNSIRFRWRGKVVNIDGALVLILVTAGLLISLFLLIS